WGTMSRSGRSGREARGLGLPARGRRVPLTRVRGAGVSALACMLAAWGCDVSGSDIESSVFSAQALASRGISPKPVDPAHAHGAAFVVPPAAFDENPPEVQEARRLGLPVYSYPEFLGLLTRAREAICVCGTHGKTTTTGMLAAIFAELDGGCGSESNRRAVGSAGGPNGAGARRGVSYIVG